MNTDHEGEDANHLEEGEASIPAVDAFPTEAAGRTTEPEQGMEALLRDNDYALRSLKRNETVEGTVVRVDPDEVLVDVGMKSEGVIPAREMYGEDEDEAPLRVGDQVLVYVVHPEGQEGHAILSLRRARMERSWREIEDLYHQGAIREAPVVDFNKGGLIVDIKGIRGFVPVSQVLDLRNVARQEGENEEVSQTLEAMKGRRLPLKVIEINRSRNRLILSERAAIQDRRTQLKDELMDQLQPGQVRRGVVSNLTTFGAFVDLGGADGLVHVSELSYNRVNHPSEVLQVGQTVDVFVLSVDQERKKIALSLKKARTDPWTTVDERYHLGQVVPVVITKLAKFGAFAKIEDGLEGLVHLSELTDLQVPDASRVVQEGQEVDAKIIQINSQRRRLGLSVRQVQEAGAGFESYGEVDDNTPFANHDFGAYAPGVELAPSTEPETSTREFQSDSDVETPKVLSHDIASRLAGYESATTGQDEAGPAASSGEVPVESGEPAQPTVSNDASVPPPDEISASLVESEPEPPEPAAHELPSTPPEAENEVVLAHDHSSEGAGQEVSSTSVETEGGVPTALEHPSEAASHEMSSTSAEPSSSNNEEDATEVASAASQGSSST